jgi:hypothetical protein
MFSLRGRPNGLEVPACDPCNQATRQHEQVAAMLGRLYPDGPSEAERAETKKIMGAVHQNVPGLLKEMIPSQRQHDRFARAGVELPDVAGVLSCKGSLLNHSIQIFGAKLGFALHYATMGRIVPYAGGVAVRWFSNFEAVTGEIPESIFRLLGPVHTLEQGKWSAGDQFNYAYAVTQNKCMAAYFSTFRISFAVLSWISEDISDFTTVDKFQVHRPRQP